jgi:hypothetical protein
MNKDIKSAVSQAGAKRKPRSTFARRKEEREMLDDWKRHAQDPDLTGTMF